MKKPEKVGRYRLIEEIGRGGMGCVFKAHDPSLDRFVAVKTVIRSGAPIDSAMNEEELRARFLREARLAARLDHSGIVRVYDAGADGPTLWIVMELIEGESLAHRLRGGLFPSRPQAMRLVATVADALAAAHSASIVHRDIKPSNILVTSDETFKISDFGVSRAIGEDTALTRSGSTVGSPAYMAPEQITGENPDHRVDLFSLAVITFQLLLRRRPFPAETVTTLIYQILNHDPLADESVIARLPIEVRRFLAKGLAKDPEDRFASAEEMAREARSLANVLETQVSPATDEEEATVLIQQPAAESTSRVRSTRPLILAATGFALLLLAIAAGTLLIRGFRPTTDQIKKTSQPHTGVEQLVTETPQDKIPTPTPLIEQPADQPEPPQPAQATMVPRFLPPTPVPQATATPTPHPTATPSPRPTPRPRATSPVIEQRFACRRGAEFHVSPEHALVTVDGKELGQADDWDGSGGGRAYFFDGPGRHLVKLTCPGYRTTWIQITVTDFADDEIVEVDTELPEGG